MQFGSDKSPDNSHRWKARTDDSFQHGPKERKRNQATFSSKVRDILEWRMMKPGTAIYLERQDDGDHGSAKKTKKVAGAMRDLWKSRNINNPKDKGPKAGQLYEIVNRHVIEDSIDKTVTLSTWRERVDGGHESDTDNMSIYYISPDGYAHEGAHAAEVNANFERRQLGSRHEFRRQNHGTSHGPVEADNDPSSTSTKVRWIQLSSTLRLMYIQGRENYNGYRHAQYNDTGSAASNKGKRTRSRAKEGGARSDSSPWASLTKFKAPNGPFIQQESTPIEKELPPPPFHPTRSGSTITSIRSASTTKFEKFLDGCRPSLVHVSDILKSLGIYKVAHLKAVARLSPETRDREVKEDALRLGMTVMEWAILVDKISQI